MTNSKNLHINEVKEYFKSYNSISIADFYNFYKNIDNTIKKNSVESLIYELQQNNIIKFIARDQYMLVDSDYGQIQDYIVISMDIIKSTKIDYKKFNKDLNEKVKNLNNFINKIYNTNREFHISQGDAIQIIIPFSDIFIYLLISAIAHLRPYKLRYAISVGSFDSELKKNSWDMNGPIFWNASDCIAKLKKSTNYDGLILSEYSHSDLICNNILSLINVNLSKITDKQWEAIKLDLSNEESKSIEKKLNITLTSYYERLSNSNISNIIEALQSIVEIIKKRGSIL
ncbi:hypothetical protein WG909_09000 [Peptostreptococcaceae bacterium AGR-M142]